MNGRIHRRITTWLVPFEEDHGDSIYVCGLGNSLLAGQRRPEHPSISSLTGIIPNPGTTTWKYEDDSHLLLTHLENKSEIKEIMRVTLKKMLPWLSTHGKLRLKRGNWNFFLTSKKCLTPTIEVSLKSTYFKDLNLDIKNMRVIASFYNRSI